MNNSTELPNQKSDRTANDSLDINSPLLQRLYSLPISQKTDLIPWFSFGGLLIVLTLGGALLYKSLETQLSHQAESRLTVKNQVIDILLNDPSRIEDAVLEQTVTAVTDLHSYSAVYLDRDNGQFSLAAAAENVSGQSVPSVPLSDEGIVDLAISNNGEIVKQKTVINDRKYVLTAKTLADSQGKPVGVLIHGSSRSSINSIVKSSFLAQIVVSLIVLILIIYLSKLLGKAIAEPIQTLQKVAQDFSEGNLQTRARVDSSDEVGLLGTTFNILADSIEINESRLRQDAERSRILKEIALDISEAEDAAGIMQIAVESSKNVLKSDRVIYYKLDRDWQGKVLAEAVAEKLPSALDAEINDPCFSEELAEKYLQGGFRAISNIYQAELNDCHLKMLEPFAVIASLATPVIIDDKLAGLLIAHQCSESRAWQKDEIELLSQIASQMGTAIEKVELVEIQKRSEQKERAARENLQRRALELLMEVDPVSRGDLTVRVKVQEDEIGTIGDSYNSTIESLRKLVAQVQTAAMQVSSTTSDKDVSIKELSTGALAQTQEINTALSKIQGITNSIQAVASNAKSAEAAVLKAAATVKAGDDAMNQTVAGFQEIRNTVAETAKKVKRLGESSQKISKVVNVISSFADQTNLLALNASIEAAHAGEEGRGFAVVADEVRSLARQSAEATAEIETLVSEIQAETNEVVSAMESGTEQVVAGTKLVDRTRNSLIEIADVSQELNQLVEEIAIATVEQSQDSEAVTQTMMQVAAISDKTAAEAGEVSASFKDLLIVAQELQNSVAKFKVS
ncbi:MAG: methyl-accepting chemotaxis protein [Cyanobacteria bacterium P01_G01_bin.19]